MHLYDQKRWLAALEREGNRTWRSPEPQVAAQVANRLRRDAILCELNPEYARIATRCLEADAGLFAQVAAE